MPLFCRHNRFEHNCPVCRREKEAAARPPRAPARAQPARRAARPAGGARAAGVVTRRIARAADDGYRNDLVPGIKATADAERLADCLTLAVARLEFPGPYPEVAEEPDAERATWLAFLLALAPPDRRPAVLAERDPSALPESDARAVEAYQAWYGRAGSQVAAFTGEASWTPQRRFARAFERLSLPGLTRARRYDLLTALGAAGVYEMEADALHVGENDATTLAAKRALVAGDTMFLERRARALAVAAGIPVAALDRGLAVWDSAGEVPAAGGEVRDRIGAALGLG